MARTEFNRAPYQTERCRSVSVEDGLSGNHDVTISDLPDAIITQILSLLPLTEAVATSLLSRRWLYAWTYLPVINFMGAEGPSQLMDGKSFFRMVNQVLRLHKSSLLHELSISCPFDMRFYSYHVTSWLVFAAATRVSRFALELTHKIPSHCCVPIGLFDNSNWIESNLAVFDDLYSPSRDILISSLCLGDQFKSLRELSLGGVDFGVDVLEAILFRCSLLECLTLSENNKLIEAKYSRPLPHLRRLEIYCHLHLEHLEISAPNLVCFKYQGPRTNIFIKDAQRLVEATVRHSYLPNDGDLDVPMPDINSLVFTQFGTYLSRLEHLALNINFRVRMGSFCEIPVLSKLRKLSLYFSLWMQRDCLLAVRLINACPLLHQLELDTCGTNLAASEQELIRSQLDPEFRVPQMGPLSQCGKLKEILVDDSSCSPMFLEFIAYIVGYAPAIEKIEMQMQEYPGAKEAVDRLCPRLPQSARFLSSTKNVESRRPVFAD